MADDVPVAIARFSLRPQVLSVFVGVLSRLEVIELFDFRLCLDAFGVLLVQVSRTETERFLAWGDTAKWGGFGTLPLGLAELVIRGASDVAHAARGRRDSSVVVGDSVSVDSGGE